MDEEPSALLIVKILSALYFISFANLFFLGQLLIIASGFLLISADSMTGILGTLMMFIPGLNGFLLWGLLIGIFLLVLGVFFFFEGLGLWNGHGWARMSSIVIHGILIVLGIAGLVLEIIGGMNNTLSIILSSFVLLVNFFFLLYLLLASSVKKYFSD